jgi:hypothetical protein
MNNNKIILLSLILFIINPFLGLILIMLAGKNNDLQIKFLIILVSLFIGLINASKVLDSDMIMYVDYYLLANDFDFIPFIAIGSLGMGEGREFMFSIFTYLSYQLIGINYKVFIVFYSFISYGLLNFALFKFGKYLKADNKHIVLSIIAMSFTPYIFTISAHLIRQFLASAILMLVIVDFLLYQKKSYVKMFIMVFTHTTTLFFIPFLFLKIFNKPFSLKNSYAYILIPIFILLIQPIASVLLNLFSGIPSIMYIFERASENTTFENKPLTSFQIFTVLIITLTPLFLIYIRGSIKKINTGFIHFFNILLILTLFILSSINQAELSVRFTFYI